MDTICFDYRPRLRTGLMIFLFGAVLSVGMMWVAMENDKGMRVFGLVFPPAATTGFSIFMAIFFALGIPIGIKIMRISFGPPAQVILSATEITAPAATLSKKTRVIPYADITALHVQTLQQNTFLIIKSNQKTLSIPKVAVSKAGDFDALHTALNKRVMATRVRL